MDQNSGTPFALGAQQKAAYLAALEAAIYRGVDYVSHDGNQIKYRTLAEMRKHPLKTVAVQC